MSEPPVLVHGARLVQASGIVDDAWMLVTEGRVVATGTGDGGGALVDAAVARAEIVDARGLTLTPGLIDLHCHGGAGHGYDDAEHLAEALALHRAHGVTRTLLSLVSQPIPALLEQLRALRPLVEADPLIAGIHLEGPFLAPARRGAHAAESLIDPSPAAVAALVEAGGGTLAMVTLAPEREGGLDAIEALRAAGVVAAVGHTEADYAIAAEAFARGATVLTHAFNAMAPLGHRGPGPIGAALDAPDAVLELILDGVHVHPVAARMLVASAPGRVALITDAMSAAGCGDGRYGLGGLDVEVHDGSARLVDSGALAGSTLTLDAALRRAITELGMTETEAVAAATVVPARVLGREGDWGTLRPGAVGDFVLWDAEWRVQRVSAAGLARR